jgi:lambda family phage portal protein
MTSGATSTAPRPATAADDLALRPFKGSSILTEFAASRQRQRREQAAERELGAAMAGLRRHSSGQPRRQASGSAVAGLPQPAFALVGGVRAFGADAPAPVAEARAFAAGASDRLSAGWITHNSGINADLEGSLLALRARSRDWAVNTDMGARFLELVQDNVVGAEPPRLQVRAKLRDGSDTLDEVANQAVEDAWWGWCQRGACDVTGQLSFGEVCRTVVAAAARDGEYLVRRVRAASLPCGYALQLLDVDRIDGSRNAAPALRGGNAVRMGVEIDALGRPVALHLYSAHPGDSGSGLAPKPMADRVPAADLLHGFVLKRPEQVRGYPWAASVLKRANTLDTYEQYAVVAAKIGAAKMGFYTVDKDAVSADLTWDQYKDATGALVQDVEAGMLEALPPGVSFESFNPDYPHQNFGAFVTVCMRGIAAGLNVAHHNLTGDMTGVNYSSARIAELNERRHWRALQKWFINAFVRPVFMDWLKTALLTGSVRLPSGATLPADRFDKFAQAATFQPPGWAWVDPRADIEASTTAMTYDMRSLRQINDEQGVDLEEVLIDKARLRDRYKALDLPLPVWFSGAPIAKPAAAQPEATATEAAP